eukprot:PhM_4_TR5218/c0_g1_i2/m.103749
MLRLVHAARRQRGVHAVRGHRGHRRAPCQLQRLDRHVHVGGVVRLPARRAALHAHVVPAAPRPARHRDAGVVLRPPRGFARALRYGRAAVAAAAAVRAVRAEPQADGVAHDVRGADHARGLHGGVFDRAALRRQDGLHAGPQQGARVAVAGQRPVVALQWHAHDWVLLAHSAELRRGMPVAGGRSRPRRRHAGGAHGAQRPRRLLPRAALHHVVHRDHGRGEAGGLPRRPALLRPRPRGLHGVDDVVCRYAVPGRGHRPRRRHRRVAAVRDVPHDTPHVARRRGGGGRGERRPSATAHRRHASHPAAASPSCVCVPVPRLGVLHQHRRVRASASGQRARAACRRRGLGCCFGYFGCG